MALNVSVSGLRDAAMADWAVEIDLSSNPVVSGFRRAEGVAVGSEEDLSLIAFLANTRGGGGVG